MRQFLFLVTYLYSVLSIAQGIHVFDSMDGKPIKGVEVYNNNYEFKTDDKGEVLIPLEDKNLEYTFSYIGYKRKKIGVDQIKNIYYSLNF